MRERKFSTASNIQNTRFLRRICCSALLGLTALCDPSSVWAGNSDSEQAIGAQSNGAQSKTAQSKTARSNDGTTLLESGSVSAESAPAKASANASAGARVPSEQEMQTLRKAVEDAPNDAKVHYAYGHALRAYGRQAEAVVEYLDATQLDPTYYVSYHELSLSKARPEQLDEAIERLQQLHRHHPTELLLCISLSELLEKRDELYPAAKVLSELLYTNTIPEKYVNKVKARIHFLINKNKDEITARNVQSDEPDGEGAPLPLPESSLRRSLSASQLKDAKVMQNFGHAPLLP
jgi:Tfp pilus assembly protein PilF